MLIQFLWSCHFSLSSRNDDIKSFDQFPVLIVGPRGFSTGVDS